MVYRHYESYDDVKDFTSLAVFQKFSDLYDNLFKHHTLFVTTTYRGTMQIEYQYGNYYIEFEIYEDNIHYYSSINYVDVESIIPKDEVFLIIDDYKKYLKKEGLI